MIPFEITSWQQLPATEHKGESGMAYVRTKDYPLCKVRYIQYSASYEADHWCAKGHIAYCIEGRLIIELSDGSRHVLQQGMSFQVSDGEPSHKVYSDIGAALFVIDGAFLNP